MIEFMAANPDDFDFRNPVSWACVLNRLEQDEDPPEEITDRAEYTEHPDDVVWIDWSDIVPLQQDLEQRHDDIKAA